MTEKKPNKKPIEPASKTVSLQDLIDSGKLNFEDLGWEKSTAPTKKDK